MRGHRRQKMLHRILTFCTMAGSSAQRCGASLFYSMQTAVGGAEFLHSVQHVQRWVAEFSCMAADYRKLCTAYLNSAPWCGSRPGAEFQNSAHGCYLVRTAVGCAEFQYLVQQFLHSVGDCLAWPPNTKTVAPNTEIMHRKSVQSLTPEQNPSLRYSVQTAVGGADSRYSVQHFLYSVADFPCMATEYRKGCTEC